MKSSVFKRLLLLLLLVLSFKSNVFATHFRYGNISWTYVSGRTVTFHISEAWRRSYFGTPVVGNVISSPEGGLNLGDGNIVPVNLIVTSVNIADDWFYGEATITYTYATNGSFLAFFTSCCRISTLQNNADGNFQVSSRVNIGTGNSSPVSSSPPIVNVSTGLNTANIQLAASDPDGNILNYRLATVAETGGSGSLVSGLTIHPTTGVISFNTVGKPVGNLYSATFVVSDGAADIMVDVIFKIIAPSNPPVFDYSVTPANATIYEIQPGTTLSFNVKALDNDPGDVVTLSAIGLPPGVILTPVLPVAGNPVTTAFSWTPTLAQLGARVVNFIATDGTGAQTTTTVTIIVSMDPVFDVPPTPAAGSMNCILSGVPYSTTIQAHAPDPAVNLRITSATIPGGATLTPALPSPLANTSSTTLNWTPGVSNFGVNPVSFTATDALGHTQTQSFDLVVNTPPIYTSSPPATTILQGQPFSYNITAADPDLPFGDILDIHGVIVPSWLTFLQTGPTTATLSGTPGPGDVGLNPVQLELGDIYHHCFTGEVVQSFTIDVLPCTFPGITCPANISVGNDPGQCGANVSFAATATGTPSPSITYSIAPGSFFPIGTTTVTATASNLCGALDCSFTVTVTDNELPTITCPASVSVTPGVIALPNDAGICGAAYNFNISSGDNCSGSSVQQTNGLPSGSAFPVGTTTNTFVVTDAAGNTSSCSFAVRVNDVELPTIICPANVAANTNTGCTATGVNLGIPAASDNCSGSVTSNDAPAAFALGATTVTWTVRDASGNTASCLQTVSVTDVTPPSANCKPATVTLLNGTASLTAAQVNDNSSDACGIQSLLVSPNTFTCSNIGANTVTLTVTDNNNNVSSCQAVVTVAGSIPTVNISGANLPVFCQGLQYILTANANMPVTYSWSTGGTTSSINIFASSTYSVTVTNANGCTASDSKVVTYSAASQLSSYVILASEKVEMNTNTVNSGGVGLTDAKGKADLKDFSMITAAGTFLKSPDIKLSNNSVVTSQTIGIANVVLPPFISNPNNSNNNVNTANGSTTTLTGTVYGNIEIGENATVIFTQSTVYIKKLKGKKNARVKFSGCTNLVAKEGIDLDENDQFNIEQNKVTVYAEGNSEISKGCTVYANIYANDKDIHTKNAKNAAPIRMYGLFIGKHIHGEDNTFWNYGTFCNSCTPTVAFRTIKDPETLEEAKVIPVAFKAEVYPNPFNNDFHVKIESPDNSNASVRIFDLAGQLIEEKKDISINSEFVFGQSLASAVYFVEIKQGSNTKMIRILKTK